MAIFVFGDYRLDTDRYLLLGRNGEPVEIRRKGFKILAALVRHNLLKPGVPLTRDELIDEVWGVGVAVQPRTLDKHVNNLKQLLKKHDTTGREYIEQVYGVGYKLLIKVSKAVRPHGTKAEENFEWGCDLLDRHTTEASLLNAIKCFQEAYKEDPNHAAAMAYEAITYIWLSIFSWSAPQDILPKAVECAGKALALDNTLSVAHAAQAFTIWLNDQDCDRKWKEAGKHFERAIELDQQNNQDCAVAYRGYSLWLAAQGRFEEADKSIERALEIKRVSFINNAVKGVVLYEWREYNRCFEHLRTIIDRESHLDAAYYLLALTCEQKGLFKEAISRIREGKEVSEENFLYQLLLAHYHAVWGERNEAKRLLEDLDRRSRQRYISPFHIALVYVHIDEEEAISRIKVAIEKKDPWVLLLKVEPRVDRLRGNPRFTDLLQLVCLDPA
jgi:DNA-binding winged helix-turn-helix (wHTH) protein/Tfp pilus assembly protein PilF